MRSVKILIGGLPGSGKTTLGKELAKLDAARIRVVELDDIDDTNALYLLETRPWTSRAAFDKELDRLNMISLRAVIAEQADVPVLILVGLMHEAVPLVDAKYFIKPDVVTVLKQLNQRSLRDIETHRRSIDALYDACRTKRDCERADAIMLYKYKIRRLFPDPLGNLSRYMAFRVSEAKKQQMKLRTAEQITQEVRKLLA